MNAHQNGGRESQIYQMYRDQHQSLVKARGDAEHSVDRAVLTLSSGALAFSLTLVQQAFDPVIIPWLLVAAWCLFGASMSLTLVSFLISKKSFDRALEILDSKYELETWQHEYPNLWATMTSILNIVAISFFLIALFLLLSFGVVNTI